MSSELIQKLALLDLKDDSPFYSCCSDSSYHMIHKDPPWIEEARSKNTSDYKLRSANNNKKIVSVKKSNNVYKSSSLDDALKVASSLFPQNKNRINDLNTIDSSPSISLPNPSLHLNVSKKNEGKKKNELKPSNCVSHLKVKTQSINKKGTCGLQDALETAKKVTKYNMVELSNQKKSKNQKVSNVNQKAIAKNKSKTSISLSNNSKKISKSKSSSLVENGTNSASPIQTKKNIKQYNGVTVESIALSESKNEEQSKHTQNSFSVDKTRLRKNAIGNEYAKNNKSINELKGNTKNWRMNQIIRELSVNTEKVDFLAKKVNEINKEYSTTETPACSRSISHSSSSVNNGLNSYLPLWRISPHQVNMLSHLHTGLTPRDGNSNSVTHFTKTKCKLTDSNEYQINLKNNQDDDTDEDKENDEEGETQTEYHYTEKYAFDVLGNVENRSLQKQQFIERHKKKLAHITKTKKNKVPNKPKVKTHQFTYRDEINDLLHIKQHQLNREKKKELLNSLKWIINHSENDFDKQAAWDELNAMNYSSDTEDYE